MPTYHPAGEHGTTEKTAAYEEQISNGFITLPGGHRIGIAGKYIKFQEKVESIYTLIYKELDSLTSDKDMEQLKKKLEDRFGALPDELKRLFDIVRIRQLGQKLGFEKIIIKNGVLIAFFISNPLSQYYRTDRFSKILENVSIHPNLFELKQNDNRLRIFSRNIDTLNKAFDTLKKL